MPRTGRDPAPFWHKGTCYVEFPTTQGTRKQYNLGRDESQVGLRYAALLTIYYQHGRRMPIDTTSPEKATPGEVYRFLEVASFFLDFKKAYAAPRTYLYYRRGIDSFTEFLCGRYDRLALSDLRAHHLNEWVLAHSTWKSPTTLHDYLQPVTGCVNWAVASGYININPIAGFRKPRIQSRQQTCTLEQFQRFLSCLERQCQREVFRMLHGTGARPKEICLAEARHLRAEEGLLFFPREESKGKRQARVIILTPELLALCQDKAQHQGEGFLFRNTRGKCWTVNALNCQLHRVRREYDQGHFSLYSLRHTFATELIKQGVPTSTVSKLMGHKDAAMVSRVYDHSELDVDFLRGIISRRPSSVASCTS